MKLATRITCVQFVCGSFSGCASSSDSFVNLCFCFQRFGFFLDMRMALLLSNIGTVEDQELLSAMPPWDYYNYARRYSGCGDALRFIEMGVNGDRLPFCDR